MTNIILASRRPEHNSKFGRIVYLSESEAAATNVYCVKAKRQQQLFSVRKRSGSNNCAKAKLKRGQTCLKQSPRVLGRPRYDENARPRKEIVLETATRLFIKEGYNNISMDDVAIACNVTKATIYYYYPTKGDLYTSVLMAMIDRIRLYILEILEQPRPFRERLEQLVENHLLATVGIDMKNFMREATINLSESQLKEVYALECKMYKTIEQAMQLEMERGTIREGNATFFAHTFLALMSVGYFKDREGNKLFQTEAMAAKEIVDFFWQSVEK